ncbi:MAG: NFACT family protein, partial [Erysipelotrichaceae bacterium]|nr:NFACT family protein [Erysipelotrichaceae bacterium]
MAIDGLMLYSISKQLNALCPCKINKIQNISDEEILFNLHTRNQGNQRCVINVHSNTNRIYLSGYMETTQSNPSNFVMVLRKCIGNGIIESIEQKNFDRILCMHITHRNELGDLINYDLYIELMGK